MNEMDKWKRQAETKDPRRWKIHRKRNGWPRWYQRWLEAWWIIIGRWSLHRAWQDGVFHGSAEEYKRIIINGGDGGYKLKAPPPPRDPVRGQFD